MKTTPPHDAFNAEHAAGYDERWAPLAPMRDSLHLQMRLVLQELPADARILCVGVGTGAELIALARVFPGWRFVAVDPSSPMLEVGQKNIAQAGFTDRCEFHACYVHELPADLKCDAATSILVSQFITDRAQRVGFFREIAKRLKPGGTLVTADLCVLSLDQQEQLFPVWQLC
ncbi:MAG: methyltransferase domain-containing protein [Opitutaceae bacterium]